ncbi:hypothetical protein FXW78_27280 [Rhodococcus opacus]|nr:hypothetical protein [Rhodococcus opacus]
MQHEAREWPRNLDALAERHKRGIITGLAASGPVIGGLTLTGVEFAVGYLNPERGDPILYSKYWSNHK